MSNQTKRSDVFYTRQILASTSQNVIHMHDYMPLKKYFSCFTKSSGFLKTWLLSVVLSLTLVQSGTYAQGKISPTPEMEQKVRETLKKNAETIRFMENKGQLGNSKVLYYFESRQGAVSVERDRIRFTALDYISLKKKNK